MSSKDMALPKLKKKRLRYKHQKVKLFRASESLISVFMWGVNHRIDELCHVSVPVMLLPDDFRAFAKIKIDNHLYNKDNMVSHYKVKEYCPIVFKNLRERFGTDDVDFRESLTSSQPLPCDNAGKSAAKLYLSYDGMHVIKTLTSEQTERILAFLTPYHCYMVETHGKSLLPQYQALYRLTVDNVEHYLVVMRSIFSKRMKIHKKYDLKGSTVDREATEKELEKELPTLKDIDFLKNEKAIYIGEEAKNKLLSTLKADVEFLAKNKIMDYSLLVGVHELDHESNTTDRERHLEESGADSENESLEESEVEAAAGRWDVNSPTGSPRTRFENLLHECEGYIIPQLDIYAIRSSEASPRRVIYFIALIDVLTQYGVKKQAAKAAKAVKYGSNVDGISTCDPEQYARRFSDFFERHIE